jgi:hypothetical protein
VPRASCTAPPRFVIPAESIKLPDLLQSARLTKNEKEVLDNLRALRTDPNPPEEWVSLSVEKEVLSKRVIIGGLPPGYIDQ